MLDIVAPDQDEAAAAIDARIIDDGEPRLAAPRVGAKPPGAEPAHRPCGRADQPEHNEECKQEADGGRHLRPEQSIKHPHYSPLRCGAWSGSWVGTWVRQKVNNAGTFAAVN